MGSVIAKDQLVGCIIETYAHLAPKSNMMQQAFIKSGFTSSIFGNKEMYVSAL